MIKFDHVGLRYGVGPEILSDTNFTLEPGSFHFLSGPSGAGKTSLLSLLYLGRRPTRGLVTMFGQNIGQLDRQQITRLRQRIGVVFHTSGCFHCAIIVFGKGLRHRNVSIGNGVRRGVLYLLGLKCQFFE